MMMSFKQALMTLVLAGFLPAGLMAQQSGTTPDLSNFTKEVIGAQELATWEFWGMGKAFESGGGAFCLTENDSTLGALIISPESYSGDLLIRYKTLALTSATVLVVMHSISDLDSPDQLTLPENYNGNMGLWVNDKDNYFHAFRNAPHNLPPFIRRYPEPGEEDQVLAAENFMVPGLYYSIEIGRIGRTLWLSVDGKKIVETEDESILPGGHMAFRIRGTAGFKAACLIRDLEIYSEAP
jgi:hypothetical protein